MSESTRQRHDGFVDLVSEIVSAYVSNNSVRAADLPSLIVSIHAALGGLPQAPTEGFETAKLTAAQIRKSITPDALISFVDGKPYKTLKRHLGAHGLTIEAYRERYGLPKDYPTVAPNYSQARSALALSLGLGRPAKGAAPATEAPKAAEPAPKPAKARKAKKTEPAEAVA